MTFLEHLRDPKARPVDDGLVPPGRYYMATWGIPPAFGGLTTVLLRRARALAAIAGVPCDVLTFSATFDLLGQR